MMKDIRVNKKIMVNVRRVINGTNSENNIENMTLAEVVERGYHSRDGGTVSVRIEVAVGPHAGKQIYFSPKNGGWFMNCHA